MDSTIILRLFSFAGFNQFEIKSSASLGDLKKTVSKILNVHEKDLKLFYDQKFTSPIQGQDSLTVSGLKLKNGDFVCAQSLSTNVSQPYKPEVNNTTTAPSKPKCNHSASERCINCMGQTDNKKQTVATEEVKDAKALWNKLIGKDNANANPVKEPEKGVSEEEKQRIKAGLTPKCTHNIGQKCLNCMQIPKAGPIKYNCRHGEGGKCPNCVDSQYVQDAKHKSFDQYLRENSEKCKGIHEPTSKCINCMPPAELSYKLKQGCANHPPYPQGLCSKCLPPNAILNRQRYRHVDYVSFMNQEEVELFVMNWTKGYCMKQKMGYLYGYYASDPNFPDGVRAVVEIIYEPPQIGDANSVEPTMDQDETNVERLIKALNFELLGVIVTSINSTKEHPLTSYDVRKMAQNQQKHIKNHYSGYKIPNFVTAIVRPLENMQTEIECFMVSDVCMALERDNIFDDSDDKKLMKIREPKANEAIPTVFMEDKPVKTIDPVFFVVNVGHGAPKEKKDMNIIKTYDFPVATRLQNKKGITLQDVKDFIKRHKRDKPIVRYSNFYYLIFLSKKIDILTAECIAQGVGAEDLDTTIFDELVDTIIGE